MIKLDVIVLISTNSAPLDRYRTERSVELVKKKLHYYEIIVHFTEFKEVKNLILNSDLCVFLVAGDLLEVDFLEEVRRSYIPSKNILLQPGYTYSFDQSNRQISKNIDIYSELACYDVLTLRYYASRHFISQTNMLKEFLSSQDLLSSNLIWSYLLFLLSKKYVLMSIQETVTFEILEEYFDNRSIKVFGDNSSNPPLIEGFYYTDILRRQNINNIQVKEKTVPESVAISMKPKALKKSTEKVSEAAIQYKNINNSQQPIRKNVSEQSISEAIDNDGLVKGINLTRARLLIRATKRFKQRNLSIKYKIKETGIDLKKTLNLK